MVPSQGNFSTFSTVFIDRAACSKSISHWLPDQERITSESDGNPVSLSLYMSRFSFWLVSALMNRPKNVQKSSIFNQ
jgi:hypothetical protein